VLNSYHLLTVVLIDLTNEIFLLDDADISIDDLNAKDEGGDDEFDDGGFDYDD
jgi:hypothetical protein